MEGNPADRVKGNVEEKRTIGDAKHKFISQEEGERNGGDELTHSCPPLQHLLSERLTSLGQQMLRKRNGGQKWVKCQGISYVIKLSKRYE